MVATRGPEAIAGVGSNYASFLDWSSFFMEKWTQNIDKLKKLDHLENSARAATTTESTSNSTAAASRATMTSSKSLSQKRDLAATR